MVRKHSVEEIQNILSKDGYTLLSDEYLGAKSKLEMMCDKGHKFLSSYHNYTSCGSRCPECNKINMSINKSLPYEYVKSQIENIGYKLLSLEYKNNRDKLILKCDCEHIIKMSYGHFSRGIRCKACYDKNRTYSYSKVKEIIESEGYTLISDTYTNNKQKLEMMCDKGHKLKMGLYHFLTGVRCSNCYSILHSSKQERDVCDYVKTKYNGKIISNDRTILKSPITNRMLELDIYLPEIKKAIEYGAKWFHSDNDREKLKERLCVENNISLLKIDHSEWINKKIRTLVMNNIRDFIGE